MPRQQNLDKIIPNKYYQLSALLKYKHQGKDNITGIIQQNSTQVKICLPKNNDIELEVGKQYTFAKCFNSKNGWVYIKDPNQTIKQRQTNSFAKSKVLSLREIFQNRQELQNYYLSTDLMVIALQKVQNSQNKYQNLNSYKLKCFRDDLIIQINIWDKDLNQQQAIGQIFRFNGFKVKLLTHNSISLVQSAYSNIQSSLITFNYQPHQLYRNVSSVFQIRKIQDIITCSQQTHKNYSILKAKIQSLQKLNYQGCSNCRKKLNQNENGCYQCGANITSKIFQYLKVKLIDETGTIECASFIQSVIQKLQMLNAKQRLGILKIKSGAKTNHNTGQKFVSHVIVNLEQLIDQDNSLNSEK